MTVSTPASAPVVPPDPSSATRLQRMAWHCRHNPKRELWFAWWMNVAFYLLMGTVLFAVTGAQPPPGPWWDTATIVQWFTDSRTGLLIGFTILFIFAGMTAVENALIAYTIRRMSVSPAFAYAYLLLYALSTFPGLLFLCVLLTVGAMRPDRDPAVLSMLYDAGFLTFSGTMGVFLVGSLVWMTAVLLDTNRVYPKWFGYFNLCNALTEVVVAPAWIFKSGPFAWDGAIAWWLNMVVFGTYAVVSFVLMRRVVVREDFSHGPLPPFTRRRRRAAPPAIAGAPS